ncbi:MAG: nicotinate (nicotinamide) nucleotide adenylyltransferase [Planctomycetota bacterium]
MAGSPRDLCLGGSFDPIHVGHLAVARAAAEATGFDRVRLLVAGTSPGKAAATAAEVRLDLVRRAVEGDPDFVVDDRELHRTGPSFTADTAEALAAELGHPPAWLIGSDLLPTLPRWHRAAELLDRENPLLSFVVMTRAGHPIDVAALPPEVRHLATRPVIVPQFDVSSTMIRDRLARGLSIRYLIPDSVRELIEQRGLYRAGSSRG